MKEPGKYVGLLWAALALIALAFAINVVLLVYVLHGGHLR